LPGPSRVSQRPSATTKSRPQPTSPASAPPPPRPVPTCLPPPASPGRTVLPPRQCGNAGNVLLVDRQGAGEGCASGANVQAVGATPCAPPQYVPRHAAVWQHPGPRGKAEPRSPRSAASTLCDATHQQVPTCDCLGSCSGGPVGVRLPPPGDRLELRDPLHGGRTRSLSWLPLGARWGPASPGLGLPPGAFSPVRRARRQGS